MSHAPVVPQTYDEWRHCIEIECGLRLTPHYIAERIAALGDPSNHYTSQFTKLWGVAHLAKVQNWFGRAQSEI